MLILYLIVQRILVEAFNWKIYKVIIFLVKKDKL
jgi:hypothetical protein